MKKLKKSLFLFSAMCIAFSASQSVIAKEFSDVNSNYWAYSSIQSLSDENIISGYDDDTFRPNEPVTRAEFATMIVKALNKTGYSPIKTVNFTDLPESHWAYENIKKAYSLNLISGYPDGSFKPGDFITKTQVLSVLSNLSDASISKEEAYKTLQRFYDAKKIPDWAIIPVAKTVEAGLTVNYPQPNFIMPDKRATRAEVAAMLYNARLQTGLTKARPQIKPVTPPPVKTDTLNTVQPTIQDQEKPNITLDDISKQSLSNVKLRGSVATLEQNSIIPTSLVTPLNSETATAGDVVVVKLANNLTTSQGVVLLPANTEIHGTITDLESSRYGNINAKIRIGFYRAVLPNGQVASLNGTVATYDGIVESATLKDKVGKGLLDTAKGTGAGAIFGTATGGITGKTGKGAVYGTAIGGGLGLIDALASKGGEIKLKSGERIYIKLTQPFSINVQNM